MLTYAEFSNQVHPLFSPPFRRPATAEKLRQVLAEFGAICPTAADVTPAAVARWFSSHPDRASLTAFSLLRAFATATKAGTQLGLLERDPFAFRPPAGWFQTDALVAPERPRHHPADQIAAVLRRAAQEAKQGDWVASRLRALVCLYCLTGLRRNEALGLRVEDVDLTAGLIWVRPNDRRPLKTAASRRKLALPGLLSGVLSDWLPQSGSDWAFPHKQLTGPWLSGRPGHKPLDCVKALGQRAGVSGLTILSLRHSYATAAELAGLGELGLQRVLGHRRPRTQHGYRHEDLDQLRRTAEMVQYRSPTDE